MKDLFGDHLHTADDIEGEEYCGGLVRETAAAILFADGENEVWLPKSKIRFSYASGNAGARTLLPVINVTIPNWLAKEKGLIE